MKRIGLRFLTMLLVFVMCFSVLPTNAFAWKILTHVNSADIILLELQRSARQAADGRASVTVYAPYDDHENGGLSYKIPEEYQEALFAYPDAFRAGSMGPDLYPDLVTGQSYIHPYDSVNRVGSGEWITLLCDSVNSLPRDSSKRKEALAFTLGFMLHYCGDLFGHDFINSFAGGTYPFLSEVDYLNGTDRNLNIILSHSSEESYMDSLVNKDFYGQNWNEYLDIAAPVRFVTETLVLNGDVNNGPASIFRKYGSISPQYSYLVELRAKLYRQANEWRPSIDPIKTTAVKYLDAWIEDLDLATYALVDSFDNMARRMITERNPSTIGIVKDELMAWVDSYGKYITPAPDILIDGIQLPLDTVKKILNEITDAIGLSAFVEDIEKWMLDMVAQIATSVLGLTGLDKLVDEYKTRLEDPAVQLDHSENPFMRDTGNFEEFKQYMDRYEAEQDLLNGLTAEDLISGRDNGALDQLVDSKLEAFYNTMVMFKLILMGPENFSDFIWALTGESQDVYETNTAHLAATSLDLRIKTSDTTNAGTDDNIYAMVYKIEGNSSRLLNQKLLDISNYNDFEKGDNDTYTVELTESVPLEQIEIAIKQESTGTAASDWECGGITVTPRHAGTDIIGGIKINGRNDMESGKLWILNFHDELMSRTAEKSKWTATELEIRLKTRKNGTFDTYGTDSDIYLDAYYGGTRWVSYLLDKSNYNDFESNDDDTYYVPLTRNGQGIPLDQISIALRHAGSDEWGCKEAIATLYHGEIQLTSPVSLGGKVYENSTWWLGLENYISSNYANYTPLSLSYKTFLDDGLAAFVNSLDDSRQWVTDSNPLWEDPFVRRNVFFQIFKGFSPEIEYSGPEEVYRNDWIEMEISFSCMWNGVRQARREQVYQAPEIPVTGSATISFIDSFGYEVSWSDPIQIPDNQTISLWQYIDDALVPGVYDIKVTYTADYEDPMYADTEKTFRRALFVKEPPTEYMVRFVDEDGTELQSSWVPLLEMPVYTGETPTKAPDAQYTYTFAGWTPEISPVTGDATYTATYDKTVNKYSVTFVNEDGTELKSIMVPYGEMPVYTGKTPAKAPDAQYTYTFAGWTPKLAEVTGSATYKATYSKTVNKYTVTFVDEDGTELQSGKVPYGDMPEYTGEMPTKAADALNTYTFAGWSPELTEVTGDAVYTAVYASTANAITLTGIKITKAPARTTYVEGETFDKSGMVVTATYSDGSTAKVTGYTFKPSGKLKTTDAKITISYSEDGITRTAVQKITVNAKTLTGIKITKAPSKTTYTEGEKFKSAGMVVTASYNNGTTAEVTDYTIEPARALRTSDTKITVSYTEGGVTKTATQKITVNAKPASVTRGDVNGDGKVNSNDAIYLLRFTMDNARFPINQPGDMNGDGKVNSNDAIYLLRHTMDSRRFPLK